MVGELAVQVDFADANSAYAAVIAAFAKSLLAGQRPTIFGDGEQSRDFTYVDNVVHANLLAMKSDRSMNGAVINIRDEEIRGEGVTAPHPPMTSSWAPPSPRCHGERCS